MSTPEIDPRTFYTERVPAQFNRTLEAQEGLAAEDAAAARLLAGMRSVKATIGIVVRGQSDASTFHLNIAEGQMQAGEQPSHEPFMTLVHDLPSLATLQRESGDSVLGFLGALAGMQEDMKLTSQRIQNLNGLAGSLAFELTGGDPLTMTAVFGGGPVPDEPTCTIRIDAAAYADLRSGALPPQDAFMGGQIQVEGDMQMAMQLALAVLSPE
jgi:putative sterol carrier protein